MKLITKAIHDLQQECPVIKKLVKGYGYMYADSEEVWGIVKPLMEKHDLTCVFTLNGYNIVLALSHESGEQVISSMTIPQNVELAKMNPFQVIGAAITYFKRYMLISALGLVTTDADADACKPKQPPVTKRPGESVTTAYSNKELTNEQINKGDF